MLPRPTGKAAAVAVLALLLLPLVPVAAVPVNLGTGAVAGNFNVVVLLVQFEDVKGLHHPAEVRDWFFSEPGLTEERSVRDYFREVSNDRLVIGGYVHPVWVTLPRPMAAYGNSDSDIRRNPTFDAVWPDHRPACSLPYDAAKAVEAEVDFAALANGGVVNLAIVHAGTADDDVGLGPDIWSHAWGVCDGNFNWGPHYVDGVRLNRYMTVSEHGQFGTIAHELGHTILGFADLYHHPDVGRWDLMASGDQYGTGAPKGDPYTGLPTGTDPAHLGAWTKYSLGWMTPIVRAPTDRAATYTLDAAEGNGATRLLRLNVDTGACSTWRLNGYYSFKWTSGDRYFLVEYRDADAGRYDGDQTRSGVVVWYIDECANGGGWWNMNEGSNPRVRVIKETGQTLGWAAMPEGASLSHLSTWSSTVDGRRTGWFVEVHDVEPGKATVRVGNSAADLRVLWGPRAGFVTTDRARAPPVTAYESVTETQQPGVPTTMTRETRVSLAFDAVTAYSATLEGPTAGPAGAPTTFASGTRALSCTATATGVDCQVPLDTPPGEYVLRVAAWKTPAASETVMDRARTFVMPLQLV
ncbi:MAG TPA: M6 family metalloprotease domain-containing protein [Candidatus Thermoplasmatota archaeon]|nr:M6 family metalloprotease domain-containing protein [Candidatus Thermoplasmatota archaeon]